MARRLKITPRKLPSLQEGQNCLQDRVQGEEGEFQAFEDALPADVRCLVYKKLPLSDLVKLEEHPLFGEITNCVEEIVTESDGTILTAEFAAKFKKLKRIAGPSVKLSTGEEVYRFGMVDQLNHWAELVLRGVKFNYVAFAGNDKDPYVYSIYALLRQHGNLESTINIGFWRDIVTTEIGKTGKKGKHKLPPTHREVIEGIFAGGIYIDGKVPEESGSGYQWVWNNYNYYPTPAIRYLWLPLWVLQKLQSPSRNVVESAQRSLVNYFTRMVQTGIRDGSKIAERITHFGVSMYHQSLAELDLAAIQRNYYNPLFPLYIAGEDKEKDVDEEKADE